MKPCETNTWLFRRGLCRLAASHHCFHATCQQTRVFSNNGRALWGTDSLDTAWKKWMFADKNYIKTGIDDLGKQAFLGMEGLAYTNS